MRRRKHPDGMVTYIIDRNINYTNVLQRVLHVLRLLPCAPITKRGYVLPIETIEEKIRETYELGGNQILLQGGHNPDLKIDYYEKLFSRLRIALSRPLAPRALPAGNRPHLQSLANVARGRRSNACVRPVSTRFRAVARRSSSIAYAANLRPTSVRRTSGSM